jgi:hypothetical protein
MLSADGKNYKTDVADTEQLFRFIQSIPSPKAEPFKLWIAKVACERLDEIEDPEIGIDRLMEVCAKAIRNFTFFTVWLKPSPFLNLPSAEADGNS